MNFVIPMAGEGTRFTKGGHTLPKMLIQSSGATLFEWSMRSLPLELADQIIFVCLKKDLNNYPQIVDLIKKVAEGIQFELIVIPQVTEGQMCTVMEAKEFIDSSEDLVIYNIDTYFKSTTLKEKLYYAGKNNIDGVIGAFKDVSAKWSFAKIGREGYVVETTEKEAISNIALTGLYHFTRGSDFVKTAEFVFSNKLRVKGEFYVAPMYNILIDMGKKFIVDMVDEFWCMGTPEDLQYFELNYKPDF